MKKTISLVIISLFTFGCKAERVNVEERVSFWETSLNSNLPIGTSKMALEKMLFEHGYKITYDENQKIYHGILETVQGDGIVCKEWLIMAKVQLDTESKIIDTVVTKAGVCL